MTKDWDGTAELQRDTCQGKETIGTPNSRLNWLSHYACSRSIAIFVVCLLHGVPDAKCGISKVYRNIPIKHVLPRPLSRRRFVPGPIRLVQVRDVRHQWVLRVGISEH